jgi:hypothetical protein
MGWFSTSVPNETCACKFKEEHSGCSKSSFYIVVAGWIEVIS